MAYVKDSWLHTAYGMATEDPALPGHREANYRTEDVLSQKSIL